MCVLTVSEIKTIKDATTKPSTIASPPIRGVGRVWAACTADVSLRIVDLAVVFENPSIIIKHAAPDIKKLIANIWIRENDNVKFPISRLSSKLSLALYVSKWHLMEALSISKQLRNTLNTAAP